MRVQGRISLAGALACAGLMLGGPAAAHAAFGVAKFEAGTCKADAPPVEECTYEAPESQFFTQAAGHPPFGITGFEVNTKSSLLGKEPEGHVKNIRVDIPPGLSVNPDATCSKSEVETNTCAGKGQCTQEQFENPPCPSNSLVGSDELEAFVGAAQVGPLSLPMYNLVPKPGVPAEFGIELNIAKVIDIQIRIVGGVSWYKEAPSSENSGVPTGDYHEYFKIENVPTTVGLIKTRLKFTGTAGNGTFITLPSVCSTQTSYLHVNSYENEEFLAYSTVSGEPPKAVSVSGCQNVPFGPSLALSAGQSETAPDRPDGTGLDIHVPQSESAGELNDSTVRDVQVTLPEGLTMNPSAANGLEACTAAQIGIGTNQPVACPAKSRLGAVAIETPMLPPKSLVGALYLGSPSGGPITSQPFTVYLAVESPRYGVGVRLQGTASANPTTGQVTATFKDNPELPFEDVLVSLNGGPRAPLANPLVCAPPPTSSLWPYTGQPAATIVLASPFSPGKGSACATSAPFSMAQGTHDSSTAAAAHTTYTLELSRPDGQQYLGQVHTTLPPGLVGPIGSVTLCGEPQAAAGACSPASQIGTAKVSAGAGSEPYPFEGPVYLTNAYGGAPYGMSIVVPAVAGPFAFKPVVTRATVSVDPHTGRVVVGSVLPTIVEGVPLRIRSINVSVNRPNFLFNPTNCGALSTDTTLTSTFGAVQGLSSPFQVTGCDALAFKPKFTAATNAKATRKNGAALTVKVGYPAGPQANIKSVFTQLPKQLPARISTLNKACTEAVFNANPAACPAESKVGSAVVSTPVLPEELTGGAYFVSHGGAAFPDLDIVLRSPAGVEVILVGNTDIKNGITSSTFASVPDVPASSFELKLPTGPYSALAANGNLCARPLVMPTTITAQSGKVIKQSTHIAVAGCGVRILSRRVRGHRLRLKLQVPAAGKVRVTGKDLKSVSRRVKRAGTVTISTRLSRRGLRALSGRHRHHRHLRLRVRVHFTPSKGRSSQAFAKVKFR